MQILLLNIAATLTQHYVPSGYMHSLSKKKLINPIRNNSKAIEYHLLKINTQFEFKYHINIYTQDEDDNIFSVAHKKL